jgi:hypothetical protein
MLDKFNFLKSFGFWGGVLFGIILFGGAFGIIIDGKFSDFAYYLGHREEFKEKKVETSNLFKNYIKFNDNNLQPFLDNSLDNQKAIMPIVLEIELKSEVTSKMLEITNREIDKFRIVTLLNSFALVEFENNRFTNQTQSTINEIFQALKYILNNNPQDYKKAASLLKTSYQSIEKSDNCIRLEVLRYLTFCYFALGESQDAIFWLNTAKSIKNEKPRNWSDYTQVYFWVDLLDLWISIKSSNLENANIAFKNLNNNADPDFLRSKFLQHELRLSEKDRKIWIDYMNMVKGE